jgi:hypothetical protein
LPQASLDQQNRKHSHTLVGQLGPKKARGVICQGLDKELILELGEQIYKIVKETPQLINTLKVTVVSCQQNQNSTRKVSVATTLCESFTKNQNITFI